MVIPTDRVTNLDVFVDENLSMDKHIANVPRYVYVSNRNIGMIRKHINQPGAELLTPRSLLLDWTGAAKTTPAITKHCCQTLHPLQGNVLTSHLYSNNYTGYQSSRESSSQSPCLCST